MTRERRPTAWVIAAAAVVPVLVTVAAVVLLLSWLPDLPAEVATHWGVGGAPDGFSTPGSVVVLTLVAGAIATLGAAAGAFTTSPGQVRAIAGIASGTGAFVQVLVLTTTGAQRGVADTGTVGFSGWWFLPALGAAAVAATLTCLLIPSWRPMIPLPDVDPVTPVTLGPTERVVWTRSAVTGPLGVTLLAISIAFLLIVALALRAWWLLVLPGLMIVAMAMFLSIRVTVDPSGLTVRGRLGWPRVVVGIDDITSVGTTEVSAMRDYGGFGYRMAVSGNLKGSKGFVLRSGPALVVGRRSGIPEVVVVNGAREAAALLEAYRNRGAG